MQLKLTNLDGIKPLELVLKNETSRLKIEDKQAHLIELLEDGCVIDLEAKTCALGHMVTLGFKKNQQFLTNVTGKVAGIQLSEIDDKRLVVQVKFTQFVAKEWEEIINFYREIQKSTNELLEKLKV